MANADADVMEGEDFVMAVDVDVDVDPIVPFDAFARPVRLSRALQTFMGKEMASRSEVTRTICDYLMLHNLMRKGLGIVLDATLFELLRPENEDVIIFNLHLFMKRHYPDKEGVIQADAEE